MDLNEGTEKHRDTKESLDLLYTSSVKTTEDSWSENREKLASDNEDELNQYDDGVYSTSANESKEEIWLGENGLYCDTKTEDKSNLRMKTNIEKHKDKIQTSIKH